MQALQVFNNIIIITLRLQTTCRQLDYLLETSQVTADKVDEGNAEHKAGEYGEHTSHTCKTTSLSTQSPKLV